LRFELLYAKHAPAVKAYVLRRANSSTADDVVAEVFVVCWRRSDEIPADPLPWLLGVARRVLSTQRRGERRRGALRDRLAETLADSTDVTPEVGDGTLAGALVRLSETDRELLLLIAWDGLSPAQAATVLGVKPATVRVRLLRARRHLTQALAREGSEPAPCSPLSIEASP
jgi:RNA polymerase sigma-70 factor (ECF subfamily)